MSIIKTCKAEQLRCRFFKKLPSAWLDAVSLMYKKQFEGNAAVQWLPGLYFLLHFLVSWLCGAMATITGWWAEVAA